MNDFAKQFAIVLFFIVMHPIDIAAQRSKSFGLEAGGAFTTGGMQRRNNNGFTVSAVADIPVNANSASVYSRIGYSQFGFRGHAANRTHVIPATVGLKYTPLDGRFRPYIVGGPGVYYVVAAKNHFTGDKPGSKTTLGYDIGGGFNFSIARANVFVESRYQRASGSIQFFPVTLGFRL